MSTTAKLIFLCGKMAAGKSTLARELARRHDAVLLVQDELLDALYPGEITDVPGFVTCSSRLQQALAPDPLRPRLLGFTRLGLAEIVRTRIHPPLHEMLRGPHAAGLSALRQIARATESTADSPRAVLRAAPDVVTALLADPVALPDLARRLGRDTSLRSDPRLSSGTAIVEGTDPVGVASQG